MSQIIQLPAPATGRTGRIDVQTIGRIAPPIRTDAVYVVHTTIEDTLAAVTVADRLAKAMAAPLTLVHFRAVPYQLPVDVPVGLSPVETGAFVSRLRDEGFDVRVHVVLCRNERQTLPMAFKHHSLIVLAGRHRRWPTQAERLRRRLEAAGHFVVFVDTSDGKESPHA
jgi:hypothetical protein